MAIKVCAISDLHGYLIEKINPCDLIVIAGDILPLAYQRDVSETEFWMANKFTNWVKNLPCTVCIGVLGNHDIALQKEPKIIDRLYKDTKYKIEFLDNQESDLVFDDQVVKVWGSPWCKIFGGWAYMAHDEILQEYYSTMPVNCDIAITHDAPAAGDIGIITEGPQQGVNAGNKVLAKIIKDRRPRVAISGHIHSSNHQLEKKKGYNDTLFATVSLLNESYQPVYEPLYFEI